MATPVAIKAAVTRTRPDRANYLFWGGLLLCTVYQSYRYPLQINTLGFSPQYGDTPVAWQAGKFVLAFPFMLVSAFRWATRSVPLNRWMIVLTTLLLATYPCIKILLQPDSQYVDVSFWMLFSLFLVLPVENVSVESIDKYFRFLLVYSFVSNFIEVFLWIAIGRLPAMASGGFYSARFGAFLDDPNGMAAFFFLLMPWAYKRYQGRRRTLIVGGVVLCLLLTESWTALGFFFLFLFVWGLVAILKRPVLAILAAGALPFFIAAIAEFVRELLTLGILLDLMEAKQGSIEGHTFPWSEWASRWSDWLVLGDWKYNAYECWWAAAMVNFGVLWLAIYAALTLALLFYAFRAYTKAMPESKPVYAGLLLFGAYFFLGSFGLPFPIKCPINVVFFVFFYLIAFNRITVDSPLSSVPAARLPRAIENTGE